MLIISILNYLHELIGILVSIKVNNVLITNSRGYFNLILPMITTWQCPFILGIVRLYNFLFPKALDSWYVLAVLICPWITESMIILIYIGWSLLDLSMFIVTFCHMEPSFLRVGMSLLVCTSVMSLFTI